MLDITLINHIIHKYFLSFSRLSCHWSMVSFAVQKHLTIIRFHLFIFACISFALGDRSKKKIATIYVCASILLSPDHYTALFLGLTAYFPITWVFFGGFILLLHREHVPLPPHFIEVAICICTYLAGQLCSPTLGKWPSVEDLRCIQAAHSS